MNPLLSAPKITGLASVVLILVAIWFGAPLIEIKGTAPFAAIFARLILCGIVLLAIGLIVAVEWLIKKQKQTAEEQAEKQAERQAKRLAKKQVRQTFAKIRAMFPVWRQNQRRLLFNLPWYIVMGEPSSGKTSMLLNAGADFLSDAVMPAQTIASPIDAGHYTWHFSKQAVFISINNTSTADNGLLSAKDPAWLAVVKFIKRYRPLRGINGVIATLNLADLLLQDEAGFKLKQQALHTSLQWLHVQLKFNVPLYLVFTHCDQLAGFQEFFNDIGHAELAEPWGIYFPRKKLTQAELGEFFTVEFERLIQQLNTRLLPRLETERNATSRRLVSYFPQQLMLFGPAIAKFLPETHYVQMRGLYFISTKQAGEAHDFVMAALAQKLQLAAPESRLQLPQERVCFVKKLLPQAILPEHAWLSRQAFAGMNPGRIGYRAGYLAAISAIILATLGLSASYARNKANLIALQDAVTEYKQAFEQLTTPGRSITGMLPVLEAAKKIRDVYPQTAKHWLLDFELYQPFKIQSAATQAFQRIVGSLFLPSVALELEQVLQQKSKFDNELTYLALKGYLVFSGAAQAKSNWIIPPIVQYNAKILSDQPQAQQTIEQILNLAVQEQVQPLRVNKDLIEKSRAYLRDLPLADFAYYELKQIADERLPQLDVAKAAGPDFEQLFNYTGGRHNIPSLYTYKGFKQLYGHHGIELIKEAADINWILGIRQKIDLAAQHMTPMLWSAYSKDYNYYWQRFLASLHIVHVNNIQQLLDLLAISGANNSPLENILELVQQNTAPIQGKHLTVSEHFSRLNAISARNTKLTKMQYQAIVKHLAKLKDYLTNLASAPNFDQVTFAAARGFVQGDDSPIRQLKTLAKQTPEPLGRWLDEIANESMGVLLNGAHRVVNQAWRAKVLTAYESDLQGRFPFNTHAEAVVSLASFGEFFGKGGVMQQFLQSYVLPFIQDKNSSWRLQHFGAHSLGLSAQSLAMLEKADRITHTYFTEGGKIPALQFAIQPRYLDGQASNVLLQYGNKAITYQHGPQQVSNWTWPMPGETQQVSTTINDFNGQAYSQTFNGQWAWFKLVETAQLKAAGGPGHYIWTFKQGGHQASFEVWGGKNLPIFDLTAFTSLHLPSQL